MRFLRLLKDYWFVSIGLVLILIICLLPKNKTNESTLYKNTNHEYKDKIVIYVSGEVGVSGKMYFYKNDTILDLVRAAGLTDYTNTSSLNLEEELKDGASYQISIVDNNEKTINVSNKSTTVDSFTLDTTTTSKISSNTDTSNLVNINTASEADLETLPSIGTSRAKKIIDYRNTNGNFKSKEDIKNVNGISDTIYAQIENFITC